MNNKINNLHERCFWIISNEKQSAFQEVLDKDQSVSKHKLNLETLVIEMFKITKTMVTVFFSSVFNARNKLNYSRRSPSHSYMPLVNSAYSGTESISFLGPKIWDVLPNEIKWRKQ